MATTKDSQIDTAVLSLGLLALLEKISDRAGTEDMHLLRKPVASIATANAFPASARRAG